MSAGDRLRLFADAIEHHTDAILLTEGETTKGPDGVRRILFVNEAYVQMTGFTREEAIGETPGITIGPASDRAVLADLERARAELRPIRIELLKYRKDGSTFWTELDVIPLFDEEGRNSHFLGILRDISARKQLQARLVEADRLAAIGTLAAGVAHEINNPLSYVLMNLGDAVERLAEGDVAPLKRSLLEALEGAERVRRIVSDMKMFSRESPGPLTAVELPAILDSAILLCRRELGEDATIVRDYAPCPPALGDGTRLGQVALNLLMNAAHALRAPAASPAPSVVAFDAPVRRPSQLPPRPVAPPTVTVRLRGDGDEVRFEIEDNGPGIPPEILPRVFDPFFTTKDVGEGTGLGLSICHGIVSALGGTIAITSEPGRGATVRVQLPAAPPRSMATSTPRPASRPRRLRILVVDDDVTVANALRRALAREHDVTAVYAGEEALAEIDRGGAPFDVVLCDLMMPGLSGPDLHEALLARDPALAARTVFMTGGAYTRAARAFVEAPGRRVLTKPFDMAAVRGLLEAVSRSISSGSAIGARELGPT